MDSEGSNDRQVNDYLGLIASEVFSIKEIFQRIASRECEIKSMLDEVADIKENLVERLNRMESIIKETVASAVIEAQQSQEIKESLEAERAALDAQVEEKEEILQSRDATIKELEEDLTAKGYDLEKLVREKVKLLEIRDAVLQDLKSTTGALNVLAEGLISIKEEDVIALEESEEDGKNDDERELREREAKDFEKRLAEEVQGLRAEIRGKDVVLGAKEMEIEMIKQTMGGRIEELENLTKKRPGGNRKTTRLVSFLVDLGKGH